MAKGKFAACSSAGPGEVPAVPVADGTLAARAASVSRRPYRTIGSRAAFRMDNAKGWRVTFLGN